MRKSSDWGRSLTFGAVLSGFLLGASAADFEWVYDTSGRPAETTSSVSVAIADFESAPHSVVAATEDGGLDSHFFSFGESAEVPLDSTKRGGYLILR